MWTRKDLKTKGKAAFKANYWKSVLVALILTFIIGGGFSGGFSAPSTFSNNYGVTESQEEEKNIKDDIQEDGDTISVIVDDSNHDKMKVTVENVDDDYSIIEADKPALVIFAIVMVVIVLIIMAVGIAIDIFLINPVEMGCNKFFLKNTEEPASLKNVFFGFENSYKSNVKTLFFRDLYVILWSLLFVIPGIVKSYEYRMIPYILSDNPGMDKNEAFELSKKMMTGNKWKAFVLDLSFIGWELLSILTCGILSIFYVDPYKNATNAELYVALKNAE